MKKKINSSEPKINNCIVYNIYLVHLSGWVRLFCSLYVKYITMKKWYSQLTLLARKLNCNIWSIEISTEV